MTELLRMEGISKEFPGVKALDQVHLELHPGEVHALMGENGAGKSTLMKVLSGVYPQSSGTITLNGEEVTFQNPSEAEEKGISIIHQEFNLFPNLSAAENIFLNRKGLTNRFGKLKWKELNSRAKELTESIGANIDVKKEVQDLTVQSQQVVEIAKALSLNAKILIMDEPSAALPESEVQKMFDVVRQLKEQGVAIVYVSHRMKEIIEIADKVTVLRDGMKVSTKEMSETNEDEIIQSMVGQQVGDLYPNRTPPSNTNSIMSVNRLKLGQSEVSFELKEGEILGFFGLMGSGTHTLAETLFGLQEVKGEMEVLGDKVSIHSPKDAMSQGIAFIPPDRHRQGLIKELSVKDNMNLPILDRLSNNLLIDQKRENELSEYYKEELKIKTPNIHQIVNLLSGGNQQKAVLAKWLTTEPKILIMEEPTRGVDVGAKAEIYKLIHQLANEGLSIILISSEMPELIGMSDRILTMNNGQIMTEYQKGEATQHVLLKDASNVEDDSMVV